METLEEVVREAENNSGSQQSAENMEEEKQPEKAPLTKRCQVIKQEGQGHRTYRT
jgi:hypothetical protein